LAQRLVDMGHIANAESDGIGIEMPVRERQALGIAAGPFDRALALFPAPPHRLRAISTMRKAMSPVPPATSSTFQPGRGLSHSTIASFQMRWTPALIRSFIRS